jgi:hypothetical protein
MTHPLQSPPLLKGLPRDNDRLLELLHLLTGSVFTIFFCLDQRRLARVRLSKVSNNTPTLLMFQIKHVLATAMSPTRRRSRWSP